VIARTLIVALLEAMHPGASRQAAPVVVDAIAVEADTPEEAALATLYAWRESVDPRPQSWDARAGVSCGPWQEPCAFVARSTVRQQARLWLVDLRRYGLRSLDGSEARSVRRRAEAMAALVRATR
jgi:hypothetical protein